jgi:hypothetical protein
MPWAPVALISVHVAGKRLLFGRYSELEATDFMVEEYCRLGCFYGGINYRG